MTAAARFYDAFYRCIGALVCALIAFIALVISLDVLMRNTGLGTLPWMLEVSEYAQFLATFLGAPWVLKHGAHVRVDVIVANLPARAGRALELLGDAVGLVISLVILWYAITIVGNSIKEDAKIIKILIIPEWWVFAVVIVSAFLLVIEFICRMWRARQAVPPSSIAI